MNFPHLSPTLILKFWSSPTLFSSHRFWVCPWLIPFCFIFEKSFRTETTSLNICCTENKVSNYNIDLKISSAEPWQWVFQVSESTTNDAQNFVFYNFVMKETKENIYWTPFVTLTLTVAVTWPPQRAAFWVWAISLLLDYKYHYVVHQEFGSKIQMSKAIDKGFWLIHINIHI